MMLLKSLEKQKANCKVSVRQEITKVRVEINETETTRKVQTINQ